MMQLINRLLAVIFFATLSFSPSLLLSMTEVAHDENNPNQSVRTPLTKRKSRKEPLPYTPIQTPHSSLSSSLPSEIKWTNHKLKHFPPKNISWEDIIESTKKGHAKYKPGIAIKELEQLVWKTGKTCAHKNWKIMAFKNIIGAKKGEETPYARVEYGAGAIHGHPITEAEYKKLIKDCQQQP